MALYRIAESVLHAVGTTTFAEEHIRERDDLQRMIRARPDVLADDLLIVAEEYALFQDSKRRVDLLAVDRHGTLVVIELKRTEDGGHSELQALRYAAMVSTMTFDQLVDTHAHYNQLDPDEARLALHDWLGEAPFEQLADQVRIILVSADFSAEITSTVLWLNQNYGLDVSCVRLVPYKLGAEIILDIQQIIPLPEAADFQVQQRQKGVTTAVARTSESSRDFTKYDLDLGGTALRQLSKQAAVKRAVQFVHQCGVDVQLIRAVTLPNRWLSVTPEPGETVKEAFARSYPERSRNYWFDLGLTEGSTVWVTPRWGGILTEDFLAGLAEASGGQLSWSASSDDQSHEAFTP